MQAILTVLTTALLFSTTWASADDKHSEFRDLLIRSKRTYSYELLDRPKIKRMVQKTLEQSYERFEQSLRTGLAVDVVDDRFVIGRGCRPHDCDVAKSTLVIDTKTGNILAALNDESGQLVKPKMASWPAAIAAAAIDWDSRLSGIRSFDAPRSSKNGPSPDVVDLSTIDGRVIYDHGGSEVMIDHGRGLIVYSLPKASLRGLVVSGQVLFRGVIPDDGTPVEGEAYVFRRGCKPAPYRVSGAFKNQAEKPTLVLRGSPPRRSNSGCAVEGYADSSRNSSLEFGFLVSP